MNESSLDRFERLPGVAVARAILKASFKLELMIVGPEGPLAHTRGGVMTASNDCCRSVLFSREGFARCDTFYRSLGVRSDEAGLACHLGLGALSQPVTVDGHVLCAVVASGFVATAMSSVPPPDPAQIARELATLDPSLIDVGGLIRKLPSIRGDRLEIARAILRIAAEEITDAETAERKRTRGRDTSAPGAFGIIGASPAMREVFELVRRVAGSEASVLIVGESRTGKEMVARAIHENGARRKGPFVAQSCAAVSDELLESSLFGHVRGAFSGALRGNDGLFGAANGGTLLLDEVAEMSSAMQVKLLRVLSDGSYLPVGATTPRKADVRVVAATHRDLAGMVQRGEFRQDLFYRLHVLALRLPPLRDRVGDLGLLLDHFLVDAEGTPGIVSAAARRCLDRYEWPGNVRELAAEVARWGVVAAGESEILPEHLSPAIRDAGGFSEKTALGGIAAADAIAGTGTLAAAIESLERAILERGLERTKGNRSQLARELDISRTTLNERLKRFSLG